MRNDHEYRKKVAPIIEEEKNGPLRGGKRTRCVKALKKGESVTVAIEEGGMGWREGGEHHLHTKRKTGCHERGDRWRARLAVIRGGKKARSPTLLRQNLSTALTTGETLLEKFIISVQTRKKKIFLYRIWGEEKDHTKSFSRFVSV